MSTIRLIRGVRSTSATTRIPAGVSLVTVQDADSAWNRWIVARPARMRVPRLGVHGSSWPRAGSPQINSITAANVVGRPCIRQIFMVGSNPDS